MMLVFRTANRNGPTIAFQIRMSSSFEREGMSIHDEWTRWRIPRWAKELYDDPKYLEKMKDAPQEKDPKKKPLWRRLPWTRTYEHMIPAAVDNIQTIDRPTLAMKIVARFKGIPLKGEMAAPKSIFQDIGKITLPGPELPPMPKNYKEFPERDLVNFPNAEPTYFTPKHRLLLFPDSWFQPFYNITGVSGPYILLGGFTAFLFSKEILVYNEDFFKFTGFLAAYLFAHHAFSYRVTERLYKDLLETTGIPYEIRDKELAKAKEFRLKAAQITDSLKAMKENFSTILKENLALQLEASYRTNVQRAYSELKRRLDYLSEVEETKERFERDMIIKAITEAVRKQIVANENKIRDRYLDNCILQLKTLEPTSS